MIEEIGIERLGVIERARLPLGPGFTALTGETGAGKTMVITALGLLLGGRADSGALRAGAQSAVTEGRWLVPETGPVAERVEEAGGELEPAGAGLAELLVTRSITAEGRSRASVGGRSAPVGLLADLADALVAVHGQSEQLRLKSAAAQREMLDRFAGAEVADLLARYGGVYRRWRANRAELDTLVAERDARAREADELRAALAEIEGVAPQPGEDEALAAQGERLGNQDELRLAAAAAHEALSTEDIGGLDVIGLLEGARRALQRAAPLDPELERLAEATESVAALAADTRRTGVTRRLVGRDVAAPRRTSSSNRANSCGSNCFPASRRMISIASRCEKARL